jgi:hypothetical protein
MATSTLAPSAPLSATGVAILSAEGQATLVQHNLGFTDYFVAIELLTDADLASVGALGIDNLQADSFEVKHTGSNHTSSFRWAVFTTTVVPYKNLIATGQGIFPGTSSFLKITHNAGRTPYIFKITPLYGAAIAGVGACYQQNAGTNSVMIYNTGQDNTTPFLWALFVPPGD